MLFTSKGKQDNEAFLKLLQGYERSFVFQGEAFDAFHTATGIVPGVLIGVAAYLVGFGAGESLLAAFVVGWGMFQYGHALIHQVIETFATKCPTCDQRLDKRWVRHGLVRDHYTVCHNCKVYGIDEDSES